MKKIIRFALAAFMAVLAVSFISPAVSSAGTRDAAPVILNETGPEITPAGEANRSQLNVALSYYHGEGVERNFEMAFSLLNACVENDSMAWKYLGYMYKTGLGTERNEVMAAECFIKSMESGYTTAEAFIDGSWMLLDTYDELFPSGAAAAYEAGRSAFAGVDEKQDFAKAVRCFDEAAKLGNPNGYYGLGLAYLHGAGVEQDLSQALDFFNTAAELGCIKADEKLIEIYSGAYPNCEDYADTKLLRRALNRYDCKIHGSAGDSFDSDYALLQALNSVDPDSQRIGTLYRALFDGDISVPVSAEEYFNAAVFLYHFSQQDAAAGEQAAVFMKQAADMHFDLAELVMAEMDRFATREDARIKNEAKLANKQANTTDGKIAKLTAKEKVKYPIPQEVQRLVKEPLGNIYNVTSNYWLLYQDDRDNLKVRVVHIPIPKDYSVFEVTDRFSGAVLFTVAGSRSGYINSLLDNGFELSSTFSGCTPIAMYALNDTESLYDALALPKAFLLFQADYIYKDYFNAAEAPENVFVTQEALCTMYIDLIPADYRQ